MSGKKVERWFTKRELAAHWRVCTKTIERLEASGKLKATKFGERMKRYSDQAVEAAERNEAA